MAKANKDTDPERNERRSGMRQTKKSWSSVLKAEWVSPSDNYIVSDHRRRRRLDKKQRLTNLESLARKQPNDFIWVFI